MNADGSGKRKLRLASEEVVSWSPDGRSLLSAGGVGKGRNYKPGVQSTSVDTGEVKVLFTLSHAGWNEKGVGFVSRRLDYPHSSPKSDRIAFLSNRRVKVKEDGETRSPPDEPGELAGAGDDGLLMGLAAGSRRQRLCRRCWQRQARSRTRRFRATCRIVPQWRRGEQRARAGRPLDQE